MIFRVSLLLALASAMTGCALVPAAVVGAAFSPLVGPVIDRALVAVHADWMDPAGTQAVKAYDEGDQVATVPLTHGE